MCSKDYYDLLQVPRGASESQIKRSYRKLALQYHPVGPRLCSPMSSLNHIKCDACKASTMIHCLLASCTAHSMSCKRCICLAAAPGMLKRAPYARWAWCSCACVARQHMLLSALTVVTSRAHVLSCQKAIKLSTSTTSAACYSASVPWQPVQASSSDTYH